MYIYIVQSFPHANVYCLKSTLTQLYMSLTTVKRSNFHELETLATCFTKYNIISASYNILNLGTPNKTN